MHRFAIAAALAVVGSLGVCPLAAKDRTPAVADSANTLTHGQVQLTLRVGTTTQFEVVEAFGAPNITTVDGSGQEVWVYDRHATVTRDESGGFSIGLGLGGGGGGDGVGGVGGLGFGKRKGKRETSSRTMTLVIKFDEGKVVSDFRSRSSSF